MAILFPYGRRGTLLCLHLARERGGENILNVQKVSALSYSQDTDEKAVSKSQKLIQSLSLDSESDYGQIFIEEISSADDFNYKVSVFGGMEIGSPYLSSYFAGLEIQGKIHPLIYLGLDYSFHDSKPNSTVKAMKNTYEGLDVSYPFLKHTFLFKWPLPCF